MPYPYGKAITYEFYVITDHDSVSLAAVTDAPAIYVYKYDSKPTRTQAIAGTDNGGLLQTVTSWSDTASGGGKTFTISAITDPDTTATQTEHTYWLAINFKLVNSGSVQTVIRALPMHRIDAMHKQLAITQTDLTDIYPTIGSYMNSAMQTAAIGQAVEETKIDLEAAGWEWAQIWRPDKLADAVSYKALDILTLGSVVDSGDKWSLLSEQFRKIYQNMVKDIKIAHIETGDDEPVDDALPTWGFLRSVR